MKAQVPACIVFSTEVAGQVHTGETQPEVCTVTLGHMSIFPSAQGDQAATPPGGGDGNGGGARLPVARWS